MKEQRTTAIRAIRHVTQPQAKRNIRCLPTSWCHGSNGTDFFLSFTFIWLHGSLSCGMKYLQLQHVGSSSLTRD